MKYIETVVPDINLFHFIIFPKILLVTHEVFGEWSDTFYRVSFMSLFVTITRSVDYLEEFAADQFEVFSSGICLTVHLTRSFSLITIP